MAEAMGASHKLDLTSDVTHLIVGNIDTAKYKYVAKQRPDVKVLSPQWIEAMRILWLKDEDVNVEEEEIKFRLPTFHGMRICLTGIEDCGYRFKIALYMGLIQSSEGATKYQRKSNSQWRPL